jgi:hypothetical protein
VRTIRAASKTNAVSRKETGIPPFSLGAVVFSLETLGAIMNDVPQ